MTELFAALLAMTLSGTLAALTAFALKKAAGDRLSPAFGCYIWLPVLLLFLLPAAMPLPDILRLPLDRILVAAGSQAQQTVPALVEGAQTASSVLADPQPAQKLIFSAMLPRSRQLQLAAAMPLLVLWAGGAVFFALVRGMDYRRIRNYLAEHSSLCGKRAQGLFDRAAETAGLSGKVKLRLCPGVGTPLVIGFLRPVIYLPHEDFSRAQLELIFAHELTHLQYKDHWFKALALVVNSFQWWNPVVYRVSRDLDYACEICCDRRVVSSMDAKRRRSYGHMLLELAAGETAGETAFTAGFAMDRRDLQRRLRLVLHSAAVGKGKQVLAVALSLGVTVIGLTLTAVLAPARTAATEGAVQSAWAPPEEYFQQLEQQSQSEDLQLRSRVLSAVDDRTVDGKEQLAEEQEALEALGMTEADETAQEPEGDEAEETEQAEEMQDQPVEETPQPEEEQPQEQPVQVPEQSQQETVSGEQEQSSVDQPQEQQPENAGQDPQQEQEAALPEEEQTSSQQEQAVPQSAQTPEEPDQQEPEEPEEEEPEEYIPDDDFDGDFIWPVDGGYIYCGYWGYYGHNGVDITADIGTDIYAAADGVVTYAQPASVWPYGKNVIIDHGGGYQTRYAHCSSVLVEEGQQVSQGEVIALVGRTGNATGPHCHFEVIYQGAYQNPSNYIGY